MPSVEDLARDAMHVDYEIWMLMSAHERLAGIHPGPSDEIARRALLESCLLHVRNLLEFFRTSKPHGDDLRAVDYFEDSSPAKDEVTALEPSRGSWEDRRMREVHKALAHIVENRGQLNTDWSEWDLELVTRRLRVFFDLLSPERRVWFPRAARWFARR